MNAPPAPSSGGGAGVAPQLNQRVAFTVKIPAAPPAAKRSGNRRSPDDVYVSPATGSISVRVVAVDGTSLQAPPAASSADVPKTCRPKGCSVPLPNVPAAVGTNTFAVTTFTGSGGQGAVISSGIVNVAVTAGGTIDTTIGGSGQLALGGYVASILLSLEKPLTFGTASQTVVVVIPQDAGGATIVGNVQFAQAIKLVLASPAPGLSLAGPGLQGDGSLLLAGPESANAPVVLAYNGSTTPPPTGGSVLTATSANAAGATVSAPPLVVLTTPRPAAVTPLPVAPKPIVSPGTSTSSVYVLDAVDNTVAEFTEPSKSGQVVETNPRRIFGGDKAGCPPNLGASLPGVNGIAVNSSAETGVSTTDIQCTGGSTQTVDVFGPAAVLNSAPSEVADVQNPVTLAPAPQDVGIAFDAKAGTLDVADDSGLDILRAFRLPSTQPDPVLGFNPASPGLTPCLTAAAASSCSPTTIGNDFDALGHGALTANEFPFAAGPDGSLYFAATDEYAGTCPPQTIGCQQSAIVRVSPAQQKTGWPALADAAYLEGPLTEMTSVISLAVDTVHDRLWVLASGLNLSQVPIAQPALFGSQEYLLAFDLKTFAGATGQLNVAPVAAYGLARFPAAQTGASPFVFANSIAAGGGRVYVANPVGPTPCPDPNCPPPGQAGFNHGPEGEVDVYDGGVSGFHLGVPAGMPSTVIYGGAVKVPVGVAFGPRGSVTSVPADVRGMQATTYLSPRRWAPPQR